MYAVIRAGGKQYRVAPGDVIRVEKVGTATDGQVEFNDVLAVSGSEGEIARPQSEARVSAKWSRRAGAPRSSSSTTSVKSSTRSCADTARLTAPSASPNRLRRPVVQSPRTAEEGAQSEETGSGRGSARRESSREKKAAKKAVVKKATPKKKK